MDFEKNELKLSAELIQDLRQWQTDFDEFYDPIDGWMNADAGLSHSVDAEKLLQRLKSETSVLGVAVSSY